MPANRLLQKPNKFGVIFVNGNWWSCLEYCDHEQRRQRIRIGKFHTRHEALKDAKRKKFLHYEKEDLEEYFSFNEVLRLKGMI